MGVANRRLAWWKSYREFASKPTDFRSGESVQDLTAGRMLSAWLGLGLSIPNPTQNHVPPVPAKALNGAEAGLPHINGYSGLCWANCIPVVSGILARGADESPQGT